MVARTSFSRSTRSESLMRRLPRSVEGRSRHAGDLNALRAAATAVSTSSAVAAKTDVISDSSL